jgi:hypothetical protein
MDLVIAVKRAQLHSGNDAHAELLAMGARGGYTIDCVMIGQSDRGETASMCGVDYMFGTQSPVRRSGVGV